MGNQYKLIKSDNVMTHASVKVSLLRDSDDDKELEIDALVASGDCFVMLATALDQLTAEPYIDDVELMKPQLEKYVHTMLYLQRYYEIVSKSPEFRQ